jgi:hypothetical protein
MAAAIASAPAPRLTQRIFASHSKGVLPLAYLHLDLFYRCAGIPPALIASFSHSCGKETGVILIFS